MLESIVLVFLLGPLRSLYFNNVVDTYVSVDPIQSYLTLLAILIAVLSLWAQLTVKTSQVNDNTTSRTASIAVFWDYTAIVIAMCALAAFVVVAFSAELASVFPRLRFIVFRGAIALAVTAFIMAIAHAFESAVGTFYKGIRGKTLFQSLLKGLDGEYYKCAMVITSVVSYLLIWASVWVSLLLPLLRHIWIRHI